jgi:Leucine-rich repeat (LRR) protein
LKDLDLDNNNISDISPLKNLVNLEELLIENNPISEGQFDELQKALPNCKIFYK